MKRLTVPPVVLALGKCPAAAIRPPGGAAARLI
jgi:hypothetical protein